MREIKFRAYSKLENNFVDVIYNASFLANGVINSNSYIELTQYTGLKDKNGVEIYEGDIAIIENYNHHGKNPKKTMIIYYDNSSTQYCCKIKETNCKIDDLIMENQPLCFAHSIEVIGNIYENKELLA